MVKAITDGDDLLPLEVEEFLSWLVTERGRAANTILAYRRDLGPYCAWLGGHGESTGLGRPRRWSTRRDRRESGAAASSVARQLAAVRMLHRYLVNEGDRADDPTADLEGMRVPAGLPKPLSEAEVTSLLDAVVGYDPLSLRDRALLELLYATGARIRRPAGCRSATSISTAAPYGCSARVPRSGSCRSVASPSRRSRVDLAARPGAALPAAVAPPRRRRGRVLEPARGRLTRQAAWAVVRRYGSGPGSARSTVAACAPPLLRHPSARPRRRPARRAGTARPRLDLDDAGVHEGQPGAVWRSTAPPTPGPARGAGEPGPRRF